MANMKKPTPEEFEVKGDVVTHNPTGASWTASPGRPEASWHNRGNLGDVLKNGDDYWPDEVKAIALQLLAQRS